MIIAVYIVVALAAGVAAGYLVTTVHRRQPAQGRAGRGAEASCATPNARPRPIVKEARLEAKEELHRVRSEVEGDLRERRVELKTAEDRAAQREEQLERRAAELERRDQQVFEREAQASALAEQLKAAHAEQAAELERISGLTAAQAKEMLLRQTEEDARHDMAKLLRSVEEEAKREAERRARNILSLSHPAHRRQPRGRDHRLGRATCPPTT